MWYLVVSDKINKLYDINKCGLIMLLMGTYKEGIKLGFFLSFQKVTFVMF